MEIIKKLSGILYIISGITLYMHTSNAAWYNNTNINPEAHSQYIHPELTPLKVNLYNADLIDPGSLKLFYITIAIEGAQAINQQYEIENLGIGLVHGSNDLRDLIPGSLTLENLIQKSPHHKITITPAQMDLFLPKGIISYETEKNPYIKLDFVPESNLGDKKSLAINLYALSRLIFKQLNIKKFEAFRGLALINHHTIEVDLNLILTEKEFTLDSVFITYFNNLEKETKITLSHEQLMQGKVINMISQKEDTPVSTTPTDTTFENKAEKGSEQIQQTTDSGIALG